MGNKIMKDFIANVEEIVLALVHCAACFAVLGGTWLIVAFGLGLPLCLTPMGYPLGLVMGSLPAYPISIIAFLAYAWGARGDSTKVQVKRGMGMKENVKEDDHDRNT
jgi:hypothetical protein